jgi:hypothetical protein
MVASFNVVVGHESLGVDVDVRPLCSPTVSADVAFGCVVELVNHTAFVERHVTSIWDHWHFMLVIDTDSQDKTVDYLHSLSATSLFLCIIRWLVGGDTVLRAFRDVVPDTRYELIRAGPIAFR